MNLRDLFLRIRALVVPRRVERELDEELAFHIEREMQKDIAAGVSAGDARTRALARFGPHAHVVGVDPVTHQTYFPLMNLDGRNVLRIMRPRS